MFLKKPHKENEGLVSEIKILSIDTCKLKIRGLYFIFINRF